MIQSVQSYSLLLEITSSARKAIRNYTKSRSIVRLSGITFPTTFLGMLTTRYNLKKTKAHDEWNKFSDTGNITDIFPDFCIVLFSLFMLSNHCILFNIVLWF